jgi:hypothetical protein
MLATASEAGKTRDFVYKAMKDQQEFFKNLMFNAEVQPDETREMSEARMDLQRAVLNMKLKIGRKQFAEKEKAKQKESREQERERKEEAKTGMKFAQKIMQARKEAEAKWHKLKTEGRALFVPPLTIFVAQEIAKFMDTTEIEARALGQCLRLGARCRRRGPVVPHRQRTRRRQAGRSERGARNGFDGHPTTAPSTEPCGPHLGDAQQPAGCTRDPRDYRMREGHAVMEKGPAQAAPRGCC